MFDHYSDKGSKLSIVRDGGGEVIVHIDRPGQEPLDLKVIGDAQQLIINDHSVLVGDTLIMLDDGVFKGREFYDLKLDSLYHLELDSIVLPEFGFDFNFDFDKKLKNNDKGAQYFFLPKGKPFKRYDYKKRKKSKDAIEYYNKYLESLGSELNYFNEVEISRHRDNIRSLNDRFLYFSPKHIDEVNPLGNSRGDISGHMLDQLHKDGLIDDPGKISFKLTKKYLKVNGKKYSSTLRDRYIRYYERWTGKKMNSNTKLEYKWREF